MKNKILIVITSFFSILFLAFIFKMSDDIKKRELNLIASPNVIDVTDTISTQLLVTSEDITVSALNSGNIKGHSWQDIKIPGNDLIQHKEFKPGNTVYYKILVPQTSLKELDHLAGQIDLGLGVIYQKSSEIYVNGRLHRKSTPIGYDESRHIVPLDENIDNQIIIKSKLQAGDRGIEHRNKILAGKSGELYGMHLESYTAGTVFPLIFILCKGSILFLFTLIYLLMNVGKFFEKFLIFSMCTVGEDVLASDFISGFIELTPRAYLHNAFNFGANLFLFLFLADVVGIKPKRHTLISFAALLIASNFIISDVLFFNLYFGFDTYLQFWNIIALSVLLSYVPKVMKVDKVLVSTMIMTIVLIGMTAMGTGNVGLNFKMYGNLFLFFMVGYQSFVLFRNEQLDLENKKVQLLEQEKDVAIGKTASLLAHDVRRPLEQMKLILDKVASGEISQEFLKAAKKDVDFSITSVNNQINDIMNYSKTRPVVLSEISFYRVLAGSLKQVMTINKRLNLSIEYDFKADVKISGDESRLASALTNLVSNAVEAIRDIGNRSDGVIRFSSRIENNKFVFTIFNDGPLIPEAMLQEIWRPLFTHGKESGTGLGLASVLKTVHDHSGEISVRNVAQKGVEFELKLAVLPAVDSARTYEFKANSRDYNYDVKNVQDNKARPIRIFLLDDDVQVHEYFQFLVTNLPFEVDLTFVSHIDSARDAVRAKRFDLYILDYDLGSDKSGLDFYQANLSFLKTGVVIHSNRDKAVEACQHVKKPMSYEELEKLCETAYETRLKVLLVDDSELTLMAWEMFHGRHNIQLVNSPEAALQFLEKGEHPVDLCVVDYYYDNSGMNGESLALKIKALQQSLRVVLASNAELSVPGFQSIDKNQFDVRSLT